MQKHVPKSGYTFQAIGWFPIFSNHHHDVTTWHDIRDISRSQGLDELPRGELRQLWGDHLEPPWWVQGKKTRFRMPKSSPILMAINHQSRWLVYDCFTNINPKKIYPISWKKNLQSNQTWLAGQSSTILPFATCQKRPTTGHLCRSLVEFLHTSTWRYATSFNHLWGSTFTRFDGPALLDGRPGGADPPGVTCEKHVGEPSLLKRCVTEASQWCSSICSLKSSMSMITHHL